MATLLGLSCLHNSFGLRQSQLLSLSPQLLTSPGFPRREKSLLPLEYKNTFEQGHPPSQHQDRETPIPQSYPLTS